MALNTSHTGQNLTNMKSNIINLSLLSIAAVGSPVSDKIMNFFPDFKALNEYAKKNLDFHKGVLAIPPPEGAKPITATCDYVKEYYNHVAIFMLKGGKHFEFSYLENERAKEGGAIFRKDLNTNRVVLKCQRIEGRPNLTKTQRLGEHVMKYVVQRCEVPTGFNKNSEITTFKDDIDQYGNDYERLTMCDFTVLPSV